MGLCVREEEDTSHESDMLRNHLREGRFQRALALIVSGASVVSGLEVAYEHYRGSYSQRIMYTPVVLSGLLAGAGFWGVFSGPAARTVLRGVSAVTLADAALGFYFHLRGIARKPGGWGLPLTNIIMGPPLFAPLLFGTAAYLGLIASYLQREEGGTSKHSEAGADDKAHVHLLPKPVARELLSVEQDVREGRFQQHMLIAAGLSALLSGAEAGYSHYKSGFRYRSQWWPVVLAPALAIACMGGVCERRVAVTAVPPLSASAVIVAGIGFFFHARGILRRPGGAEHLLYNIMYGPPIFAPLLFGAAGGLGLLASQLRRSR